MTTAAARSRNCAGVLVDGPVTDVPELAAGELPVFSRESTCLTTKRHASDEAEPEILRRIATGESLEQILYLG